MGGVGSFSWLSMLVRLFAGSQSEEGFFSSSGGFLLFVGFQVISTGVFFFVCPVCLSVYPKTDRPCQRKDVDGLNENGMARETRVR